MYLSTEYLKPITMDWPPKTIYMQIYLEVCMCSKMDNIYMFVSTNNIGISILHVHNDAIAYVFVFMCCLDFWLGVYTDVCFWTCCVFFLPAWERLCTGSCLLCKSGSSYCLGRKRNVDISYVTNGKGGATSIHFQPQHAGMKGPKLALHPP